MGNNKLKEGNVWTRDKTAKLINLYKKNECLWNTCLETYKCKEHRSRAFKAICSALNLSKEHLCRKIHNLRNQFNAEMKKINRRSGNVKEEAKCRWEYYESLLFLKDFIAPRPVPGFIMTAKFHANNSSNINASSYEIDSKFEFDDANYTNESIDNQEIIEEEPNEPNDQEQIECVEIISKEELQDMRNDHDSEIKCKSSLQSMEHHYIQSPAIQHHSDIITLESSSHDNQQNEEDSYSLVNIRQSKKRKISVNEVSKQRDEWDVFGEFVAAELRDLNSTDSKKILKRKIMAVILEVGEKDDNIKKSN